MVLKLNGENGFQSYEEDAENSSVEDNKKMLTPENFLKNLMTVQAEDVKTEDIEKDKCKRDLHEYEKAIFKREEWALKSKKLF